MFNGVKGIMPRPARAMTRHLLNHWRQLRFGKRGVPKILCGESYRFKLGFEPVTCTSGKFWEDDRMLMQQFYETINAGQVVVDVGAFVGHYTMLAARRVGPIGRVVAFEPAPWSYRVLIHHLVINDLLDRVEVWPMATANSNAFAKIYFDENDRVRGHNATNSLPFEQKRLTQGLVYQKVPCVDLGLFLEEIGVRPDVVKIDVEGDEIKVLQSLARVLESDTVVFCELHPHLWPEPGSQASALRSLFDRIGRFPETLNGYPVSIFQHEPVVLKKMKGHGNYKF
jgi:FkbM family methyltransferase